MTILVTGGAGFIGSHIVDALLAQGHTVRVLDNLSSGRRDNLSASAELIEGDIADFELVLQATLGCTHVIHQAALVSVPLSIKQPVLNYRSNIQGTFNVFEAARQQGVQRLVYASSAAVYGNRPGLPKRETDPVDLLTPYAAAKFGSENLATVYNKSYGMECVGLRYMNVYGPRQDPSSPYSGVLSIFCQRAMAQRPITVFGDGDQTRDFIFVSDIVAANLLALSASFQHDTAVYNVGRGEQTSLNMILSTLDQLVESPLEISYAASREGDIKHSVADIGRIEADLNFQPTVSLTDGLAETILWFQQTVVSE